MENEDKRPNEVESKAEARAEVIYGEDAPLPFEAEDDADAERERLAAELEEAKAKHLRALADIENNRRRFERDIDEARKYAATGFARDMLEVADNLRRALASLPEGAKAESEVVANLLTGVEMTERTLLAAFEKHKIGRIEPAKGDRFDHNLHQAMFELPTAAFAPGSIAEVMQPGYQIAGRLLRPAMVGVAKALPEAKAAG